MRIDLEKHSHLTIILLSVLVGMVLMAGVLYYPRHERALAEPATAAMPSNWQTAFSDVAAAVLPAVVSIQGKVSVEAPAMPDLPDLFRGWPFGPGGDEDSPQMPRSRRFERPFLGSGWIYSPDGYIVTNAHVVKDATSLKVQLHDVDNEDPVPAKTIGYDPRSDLAVIKVDVSRKLPYLALGSSKDVKVGQWVIAVGSPFSASLEQTVTVGIISAKGRILEDAARQLGAIGASIGDVIQTDAAINPGNSGGPLVDLTGRVVGINESIISPGMSAGNVGIGFAISADTAARVIPQLIQNKRVVRGWLGISISDLNENMRDFYKAPQGGALVNNINPDGPAAKSNLQADDVVIQAGGEPVRKAWDLQNIVGNTPPGTVLQLVVLRNGQRVTVDVRVGEMPEKYAGLAPAKNGGEEPSGTDPLGLQVKSLLPSMPQAQQLGVDKGVVVVAVDPEGPSAGKLREGDVITEINRTPIADVTQYRQALEEARKAQAKYVILRFWRQMEGEKSSLRIDVVPKW